MTISLITIIYILFICISVLVYHCLLRHQIEASLTSDHISSRVTFYVTFIVKFLRIHHPLKYLHQRLGRFVQPIQYHLLLLLSISSEFFQCNLLFYNATSMQIHGVEVMINQILYSFVFIFIEHISSQFIDTYILYFHIAHIYIYVWTRWKVHLGSSHVAPSCWITVKNLSLFSKTFRQFNFSLQKKLET